MPQQFRADLCKLLGVGAEHGANLEIRDVVGDLTLVHYVAPTPGTAHVRGTIVDTAAGTIVCPAFPHVPEYGADEVEGLKFDASYTVAEAHEGIVLRAFRHGGRWQVATHHRIASGDKIYSKFLSVWEADGPTKWSDVFHADKCYFLLLCHASARVVSAGRTALFHIATLTRAEETWRVDVARDSGLLSIPRMLRQLVKMEIPDKAALAAAAAAAPAKDCAGLLVANEAFSVCYRVVSPEYRELCRLRGDGPIFQRFRELHAAGDDAGRGRLAGLYPDEHADYANAVARLPKYLAALHRRRFVDREFLRLPGSEFHIVSRAEQDRANGTPIGDAIEGILRTSTPQQVAGMVGRSVNGRAER
uniref:RNA ligase with polynucleotide kinase domain n=1 Tax=Marseillevirus LCMAC103 TaxID=2506604 RepID=A0A481YVS9_9VIRU|nr:MAG: RNA ligase with polynucleotide kinase domain [Marseillevirus LCMAC103]